MWWIEIVDIEGNCLWSTWPIDSQRVKDSNPALYAVADEESDCFREVYSKTDAEETAQQFRAHTKVSSVRLVQVFQKSPGESVWQPLWGEDKERLGY